MHSLFSTLPYPLFPTTHQADLKLDQQFEPKPVASLRRELLFHSRVVGKSITKY